MHNNGCCIMYEGSSSKIQQQLYIVQYTYKWCVESVITFKHNSTFKKHQLVSLLLEINGSFRHYLIFSLGFLYAFYFLYCANESLYMLLWFVWTPIIVDTSLYAPLRFFLHVLSRVWRKQTFSRHKNKNK